MTVLVTQPIPYAGIEHLRNNEIEVDASSHHLTHDELKERLQNPKIQALLCTSNDRVEQEVIDVSNSLRVISTIASGVNNIDVEAATQKKIVVTNTPGMLSDTVAELIFTHILALSRRLEEMQAYVRTGEFEEKGWHFGLFLGLELKGKTLGIVGMGNIGKTLVPKAEAFGMNVLCTDIDEISITKELAVTRCNLNEVLLHSDYVALCVPLTDETRHLIAERELDAMKPGAFLINTSRGPVVCEDDLVHALREKKIAGAGLDVYEYEPRVHEELRGMKNVVLTPHNGSGTHEAQDRMSLCAARNVLEVLQKGTCTFRVN